MVLRENTFFKQTNELLNVSMCKANGIQWQFTFTFNLVFKLRN
jgi:hypothetical protein